MKYYDVSSDELAADTNVAKDLIDGWLSGELPTDPKAVSRVADALGVSARTLNPAKRAGTTQATSKKLETKFQSSMFAAKSTCSGWLHPTLEFLMPNLTLAVSNL